MTLIIGLTSADYVMLVSDRRITWMNRGVAERAEDTENKAIVLAGQWLMGYTGLARLGGVPTSDWVADNLQNVAPERYALALVEKLPHAIAATRQPLRYSGHAFMMVGFNSVSDGSFNGLERRSLFISNALGKNPLDWRPGYKVELTGTKPLSHPNAFEINPIGITPKIDDLRTAVKHVRRYRRRRPGRVLGVAQILVGLVRKVAALNPGVGSDVSVSILPRVAVGQQWVQSLLVPLADPVEHITSVFAPDGVAPEKASAYGPTIINSEITILGSEVWTGEAAELWWKRNEQGT